MKNAFYFIQKALLVLEIFNFLFFPSFPHFSDLKAQIKLEYLWCFELAYINYQM